MHDTQERCPGDKKLREHLHTILSERNEQVT